MITAEAHLHLLSVAPAVDRAVSALAGPEAGHAAALLVTEHLTAAVRRTTEVESSPRAPAYVCAGYRSQALDHRDRLRALETQGAELRRQLRLPTDAEWGEVLAVVQALVATGGGAPELHGWRH